MGDYMAGNVGINWWYLGHSANVKLQAGVKKQDDGDGEVTNSFAGAVQSQLYFYIWRSRNGAQVCDSGLHTASHPC